MSILIPVTGSKSRSVRSTIPELRQPLSKGPRLWSLAAIARERLADGKTDDPAALVPNYLRMPSIGGPKRRDWVRQGS